MGHQVRVNVFRTQPGGGWLKLSTDPAVITLDKTSRDFAIPLPAGLKPSDLHAVQFVLGDGLNPGNLTFRLDEVRVTSDGCDPARLVQSYRAEPGSTADRDVNVYPQRSFLYDNALAIQSLWATGDAAARTAARELADAVAATAPAGRLVLQPAQQRSCVPRRRQRPQSNRGDADARR